MLNQVQIYGLFLNLIIYIIMVLPIVFISFRKSIYESKEKIVHAILFSLIFEIVLSLFFHFLRVLLELLIMLFMLQK